jgi:hypothetical protein
VQLLRHRTDEVVDVGRHAVEGRELGEVIRKLGLKRLVLLDLGGVGVEWGGGVGRVGVG